MKLWFQKNKKRLLLAAVLVVVLAAAYWFGGDAPGARGFAVSPAPSASLAAVSPSPSPTTVSPAPSAQSGLEARPGGTEGKLSAAEKESAAAQYGAQTGTSGDADYSASQGMALDPSTGKDAYGTAAVPSGEPVPVDPQSVTVTDKQETCTLSISCAAISAHMDWLDPEKKELVPADGWLLKPTTVTFYEGESVFNVLQRTCRQQGIHMEFENVPLYNSAYIEGIGNLYEFDCGELSGWMYRVNGWFPNYGCSRYALQAGDTVEWVYTCTLGADVGGAATAGNGQKNAQS